MIQNCYPEVFEKPNYALWSMGFIDGCVSVGFSPSLPPSRDSIVISRHHWWERDTEWSSWTATLSLLKWYLDCTLTKITATLLNRRPTIDSLGDWATLCKIVLSL